MFSVKVKVITNVLKNCIEFVYECVKSRQLQQRRQWSGIYADALQTCEVHSDNNPLLSFSFMGGAVIAVFMTFHVRQCVEVWCGTLRCVALSYCSISHHYSLARACVLGVNASSV